MAGRSARLKTFLKGERVNIDDLNKASTGGLAETLGITDDHVDGLVADGVFKRHDDGTFAFSESIRAYIAHHDAAVAARFARERGIELRGKASTGALADMFGVACDKIDDLVADRVLTQRADGTFHLSESVRAYIAEVRRRGDVVVMTAGAVARERGVELQDVDALRVEDGSRKFATFDCSPELLADVLAIPRGGVVVGIRPGEHGSFRIVFDATECLANIEDGDAITPVLRSTTGSLTTWTESRVDNRDGQHATTIRHARRIWIDDDRGDR